MEPLVNLSKSFIGDVCVYLRCTDIAVPQHHLYRSKIRAILEQMSGETMSKHVRCDVTDAGLFAVRYDDSPECLPA